MGKPVNNVYEMRILVRPGPGCGMPPDAVGGEALCFVGAPDPESAVRLAFGELSRRGFVCEDLIGRSVGQIVPERWEEHAQDVRRDLGSRFCSPEAAAGVSLPDPAEIRKLIRQGGFHLGPFFCWDTEPPAGPEDEGPGLSDEEIQRHDERYNAGYELVKDLVFSARGPYPPDSPARGQLREAIRCFEEALAIVPANWQALLLMGKAHQCLGEYEQALAALLRAHECEPTQLMVAVETGAAAGRVGRHDVAVRVMEAAAREHPDDPRLPFNLGISYLFLGDFAAARRALERAVALEPDQDVNKGLLDLLGEVEAGKRPCPKSEEEIAKALS
jgi:tetratricopeptide (TPR) repeat protein